MLAFVENASAGSISDDADLMPLVKANGEVTAVKSSFVRKGNLRVLAFVVLPASVRRTDHWQTILRPVAGKPRRQPSSRRSRSCARHERALLSAIDTKGHITPQRRMVYFEDGD
jgi:hypothetical protein